MVYGNSKYGASGSFNHEPSVEYTLTILTREVHIPVLYDVLHAIRKWKEYEDKNKTGPSWSTVLRSSLGVQIKSPHRVLKIIPNFLS